MNLGKPIASGNTADIYLAQGKIVKLLSARLPAGAAEYEARKQRTARALGFPAPEIYDVTHVDGRQALVMEYVSGPSFGDLMLRDPSRAHDVLALSVDMQLRIHAQHTDKLERLTDRLRSRISGTPFLDADMRTQLLHKLDTLPTDDALCHGDFHAFNLIQSPNGVVVIDWVDLSCGAPCADACRSYLLYLGFHTDIAELYLAFYCEKAGVSRQDVLRYLPVIAAARLDETGAEQEEHRRTLVRLIRDTL